MKINGIKVETKVNKFAYDGCHKIYILKDYTELAEAKQEGYTIYHISDLGSIYNRSCPLKFINSWDLKTTYAPQGEEAIFDEKVRNKDIKWQKLKEILKRQIDVDKKEYLESGFPVFKNYVAVENFILQKMQELEAEDESKNN